MRKFAKQFVVVYAIMMLIPMLFITAQIGIEYDHATIEKGRRIVTSKEITWADIGKWYIVYLISISAVSFVIYASEKTEELNKKGLVR